MCDILTGLKSVVCLIDDVLVCGTTQEEHDQNLLAVLHSVQEAGLILSIEKNVNSAKVQSNFWVKVWYQGRSRQDKSHYQHDQANKYNRLNKIFWHNKLVKQIFTPPC